jgi:mycofactocin precursor peptide peptidase
VLPGADAHAGRTETAILLALAPELVRVGAMAPGNTAPLDELLARLRAGGTAAVSPDGVLGDPTGATGDEGERLLHGMARRLRTALDRWRPDPAGRL